MEQYFSFIFESYAYYPEEGLIELKYSLDDSIRFIETIRLPEDCKALPPGPNLNRLLFLLHLIGGISYYKTCLPKRIEIRSGKLNAEEAAFWTQVYENGLGEFFYRNKMDYWGMVQFPVETGRSETDQRSVSTVDASPNPNPKVLVPFGGGKDSIVTAEMLKAAGHDVTLLRIGNHPLITAFAKRAGFPLLAIERRLDPLLFTLNAEGALNGHVPITAYLSILSVIVAELYGFSAAVWSNERSASEGNTKLLDLEVNHQWSKGIAFERALQMMLELRTDVQYFSLLRSWSELRIVQEFCKYSKYFSSFTSCNENWKIAAKSEKINSGLWCCECPKCAFAFVLFAAFLPRATLEKIFGANLLNSPALEPTFRELLGLQGCKPFECVGTPDEVRAAFLLGKKRGEMNDTAMMRLCEKEVIPSLKDPEVLIARELAASDDHVVPQTFLNVLPKN